MTNLITADFHGTQVMFQDNAYLNATAIAKRFDKLPKDYLKTEQTKEYIKALKNRLNSTRTKILVKENQLVRVQNGGNNRGTWLHPKLAIDFARWLSAEFAVWCDEQIENILNNNQAHNISTTTSRIPLKDAVNMAVAKTGMIYSDCYKMIHQRFGVESVTELTDEQLPQAIEYVHKVLTGEILPKIKNEPHINESKESRIAGIALMYKGVMGYQAQEKELLKLERLVNECQLQLQRVQQYRGCIYDALFESRCCFKFNSAEDKEGLELARQRFNARY